MDRICKEHASQRDVKVHVNTETLRIVLLLNVCSNTHHQSISLVHIVRIQKGTPNVLVLLFVPLKVFLSLLSMNAEIT